MSTFNEQNESSTGSRIIDQLAEQLNRAKLDRKQICGEDYPSVGFVQNFSDTVNNNIDHSRRFTSQELQLLILTLLVDKPAHGYELIKALETVSKGIYSPNPGMVYPALTYLDELGHIVVTLKDNRKNYMLSDTGKQYLTYHQERVDTMWFKLANNSPTASNTPSNKTDEEGTLEINEKHEKVETYIPELINARYALRSAIVRCSNNASVQEQRRITEILLQAARNVLRT